MAKRWWTIGLILVQLAGLLAIPDQAAAHGVYSAVSTSSVWRPMNGSGLPPLGSLLVNVIVADPTNPKIVYLGTSQSNGLYGGVYRTTDSGSTWLAVNTGLPTGTAIDLLAISPDGNMLYARNDADSGMGLFRSPTGDVHWTQLSTFCCDTRAIFSLYVDTTNVFLGVFANGIYRSVNQGDTWMHLDHSPQRNINAIAGISTDPNLLYAASGGIYKSMDGGENWDPVSGYHLDECASGYADAIAIDPADTDVILAGDNSTCLERSEDGGISWTAVYESFGVSQVVFDPTNPDLAYLLAIHVGVNHDGILKSSDNGKTWADFNGGLPTWDISGFALGPGGVWHPSILYAAMPNKGIYTTAPNFQIFLPNILN